MRLNLKLAILSSGKTQREIARECEIPEPRLSEIVRGWREPTPQERERLVGTLKQPGEKLFELQAA
jgi:plasmid maintenance system antidote protein VapI